MSLINSLQNCKRHKTRKIQQEHKELLKEHHLMQKMIWLPVLLTFSLYGNTRAESSSPQLVSDPVSWQDGFKMMIRFPLLKEVKGGWTMSLRFSQPSPDLQIWRAKIESVSDDNTVYNLTNMAWNADFAKCAVLEAAFTAKKDPTDDVPTASIEFHRKSGADDNLDPNACLLSTTSSPTTQLKSAMEEKATALLDPHVWPTGFKMTIHIKFLDDVVGGWNMVLKFSKPTPGLQIWRATIIAVSSDKKTYTLKNMPWNKDFMKCTEFTASFMANKVAGTSPPTVVVEFKRKNGQNVNLDPNACPTTMPPTTTATLPPSTTASVSTLPGTTSSPTTVLPTTDQPTPSTVATMRPTLPSSPSTPWPLQNGLNTTATLLEDWETGFKQVFRFLIKQDISDGWIIKMKFSKPVFQLQMWRAQLISQSDDNTEYYATNMPFNAVIAKCSVLEATFMANKQTPKESAPTVTVTFYRKDGSQGPTDNTVCATTMPPTTMPIVTTQSPVTNPGTVTEEPPSTQQTTSNPGPTTSSSSTTNQATTIAPVTATEPATSAPGTTQTPTESPTTSLPTTRPPTTPLPTKYDYSKLLHDSILFYEAQRSGKLPATNRIAWRGDSALGDKGDKGEDLTGGWYDAGDFVKFGFPMASSVTVLAWGVVEYRDAYKSAGELDNVLDSIKWATDYFIKAHTAKYEFYGQVGDGHVDHAYWGRPEDMTMKRPAFKITVGNPGSELAAETAAALAATSIIFQETNQAYAGKLVKHAEELYEFADKYREKYTTAIPNAASFYNSFSGYNDELVWGAAWLYKATKKPEYLSKAESYYQQFGMNGKPWVFSWDDKKAGVQILLAEITGKSNYRRDVQTFVDSWLPGRDVSYTPKGLAWRDRWGPNRYAANTAFLALVAADNGIRPDEYRTFARKQIHYMLGDSGRSFVVGFGNNPPKRPHHRSSSCPDRPAPCNHNNLNAPGPNPQTLTGALVGGPDKYDNFKDDRKDYVENEVATDYNAGFQSAVAGLKHLAIV